MRIQNATTIEKPTTMKLFAIVPPTKTMPSALTLAVSLAHAPTDFERSSIQLLTKSFWNRCSYCG